MCAPVAASPSHKSWPLVVRQFVKPGCEDPHMPCILQPPRADDAGLDDRKVCCCISCSCMAYVSEGAGREVQGR